MKKYENYDLKNNTTSKISSVAKVVYIPESKEEFVDLLKTFDSMPVIIGGGSNVLLSSHGVDTPVILTTNLRDITINNNTIKAQCGVKTGVLSKTAADNNLSGMEFLFVIPATVGGVVKMNSSAHSQSIKDIIISAEVFDIGQKKVLTLSNDELELSYRTSILQKKPLVLLEAVFNLEKQNRELIDKRMQENLDYRKEKQPALTEPNFGSTFRNPQGAAVGKMIEELGLKGTVEGGAKISEIHGNFIVNYSKQATSTDVLRLMFKMYNAVKQKFGYEIKTEVIFIGNMTEEEKKDMDTDKKPLISYDTKIGVLYGGMSSERDVSLRSGKNCYEALLRLGYKNVELIDVDKNIASKLIEKNIELAYIALHGKYGEDGCIQGLLEILGIPYTGCGVEASAVCMNKETTKKVLKDSGIPLIKSVTVKKEDDIFEKIKGLSYPFMVKPLWEGSSIGMSKASDAEELKNSVEEAFKYSPEVMIEEYLIGKSTTVGVLDLRDKTIATSILEFRTKTEWYDFEAKYTKGLTEFVLPAELDKDMTDKIKSLAIKAHKTVGATGMSRVDFLVTQDTPYVLEINTIPGMTDLSDLPAQSKDIGISYDELVNIILQSATMPKK